MKTPVLKELTGVNSASAFSNVMRKGPLKIKVLK
jgi:hypothetical protein